MSRLGRILAVLTAGLTVACSATALNLDGRVSGVTLGAGGKTYTFDPAGRITQVTDLQDSSRNQTHGYDGLDRLTSSSIGTGSFVYAYDLTGNRTSKTVGGATTGYTVSTSSNRLLAQTGAEPRSYTFDAAGNVTGDGAASFGYDHAGRRTSATVSGQTWSYAYNGFGQRVRKSGPTGSTLFAYDNAGHLIGEYDGYGAPIREYLWLGDTPIAVLKPNGFGTDISYIHADHRNAPRLVTSAAGNAVRWRWESEAFGNTYPDENPAGQGAFTLPLRDPGQYADTETGLNYNGFRDYRPGAGRYDQSDPIGLAAGVNTFGYVGGDPLRYTDPSGLILPALYACALNPACVEAVAAGTIFVGNLLYQYIDHGSVSVSKGVDALSAFAPTGLVLGATATRGCSAVAAGRNAAKGIGTIDTAAVRFSQDSVKGAFRNGTTLNEAADALRAGGAAVAARVPPIRLVEHDGLLFTLDNRRLLVFSQAGQQVPFRMATEADLAREFASKFSTTSAQGWGQFITVRP